MGKTKPYLNQNYDSLKSQAKSSGNLFVDPEFPPEAKSIYQSKEVPSDIVWKRPGVSNKRLRVRCPLCPFGPTLCTPVEYNVTGML